MNMEVDESDELISEIKIEVLPPIKSVISDGDKTESDPMFKFINGEIDFNDYLDQMEETNPSDELNDGNNESSSTIPADVRTLESSPVGEISEFSDLSDVSLSLSSDDEMVFKNKTAKKKKMTKKVTRSKLPVSLQGLMGEANLRYAKGDTENAVKMCLEIIKEVPKACEPFKTLASIYEEMGKVDKSVQMRLFAAYLGPASKDEWLELAQIFKKKDQHRQAVLCLTKAINFDPLNLSLYEDRAESMKLSNISSVEAYGFGRLLNKLDPQKDGETILMLCHKIAKLHYNDKKYEKTISTLKYAFDKCPERITLAEANVYLDVLIMMRDFSECFRIFTKFCKIDIKEMLIGEKIRITDCVVPEDLPTDIRAKLIVFLLSNDSTDFVKVHTEKLLEENPEEMGDLFWDVGLALFEKKHFEDAIRVLSSLTNTKNFNTLSLWFKLTQCYKERNKIEECLQSYRKALEYFPDDSDLKFKFCKELIDAQLYEEAIEVTLSTTDDHSVLIYERCKLYHLLKDYDNFLKTGWQLFRLHCKEISNYEDYLVFKNALHHAKRLAGVLSMYVSSTIDTTVSLEDEWQIYLKMCEQYIDREEFDMLMSLSASLFISFKFVPQRSELKIALIIACFLNDHHELGYPLVRDIIHSKKIYSNCVWNILNLVSMKTDSSRLHKFLTRYLQNNPKDSKSVMLYANNSLISGSYKYALNDHTILFQKFKTPMLALIIGILFTLISCQKYSSNKHALVAQALAFFSQYKDLREPYAAQEVNYNLGRFFHQLELLPQAVWYYKKALEADVTFNDKMFDLKCDAAYNLHLIYMNSDQPALANMYLKKYVII